MYAPIEQKFHVPYSYKLYFTSRLFAKENPLLKDIIHAYKPDSPVRLLFVVDQGVAQAHPDLLADISVYGEAHKGQIRFTESLVVPGGEICKHDAQYVDAVLGAIDRNKICRHSFVVAVGGGAIIDMVGYAAATAHRGVKLIRIPTTVLSQNDSAVGVKNSVNALGKKNFLGTFAPPYAIIDDHAFLATLEQRDWVGGISEALKVALIKDAGFFEYLEAHADALRERDDEAMAYTIYKCAEMHMDHIAKGGDPFESGSSRPLDFGHWAAHKMEQMTQYAIRHGEAVAKGIALDVIYAHEVGLIPKTTMERILKVFDRLGLDLRIPVENENDEEVLFRGIEEFREHLGGELTITLISEIGKKHDVHTIDREKMAAALHHLNHLYIKA